MATFLPKSVLYGKEYNHYRKIINQDTDVEEYQLKKIKETLEIAYQSVPYYQKVFREIDFNPNDLKRIEQISELPYIDKDIVRQNYEDFNNINCKNSFEVTTGGSSGDPMRFLQSRNVWAKEMAFIHSYSEKYGYDYSLKVTFRGGDFPKEKIYQFNPINNEIQFSPFLINKNNITEYAAVLNKYKPKFLHAYPSAVRVLMENLEIADIKLNFSFEVVFLISENIEEKDIKDFSEYFGAKVTGFYGHSERLLFAPLVSNEIIYKINGKYGYGFAQNGELIATSFDNYAMPLINYRTHDYLNYWKDGEFKVRGRWETDFVIGKNDEKISLTALNVHSKIFDQVISYQYVQNIKGIVTIACVAKTRLREAEIMKIREEFNLKTRGIIDFEVMMVDKSILTERGKFKKLITGLK